ncbi:hypothetical protein [Natronincola ferrireducens]|uniref:Uncharacterized protein n=1 Tax=Natronincola ferrireducens TaxID=393762 RepID=A0A1G8Z4J4_9FIRM|nr:hypothetical protein [Natronincola ferrireducens]SDK10042.1 hypothetical protein SAMN05660472_00736 [Natronincola ferrireducens]
MKVLVAKDYKPISKITIRMIRDGIKKKLLLLYPKVTFIFNEKAYGIQVMV